jgi:hypothetical protein
MIKAYTFYIQERVEFGVSIATKAEKCPPSYANNKGER